MPCIDITLPKTTLEIKTALAGRLTQAAHDVAGFEPEILRLRFYEYGVGEAGVGGKLWDGQNHAHLHILVFCPRLKRSVKKVLIENMSRVFGECTGRPDWQPVVHICEHPYDNIGAGGKILWERHPEVAGRKFYYDLPDD